MVKEIKKKRAEGGGNRLWDSVDGSIGEFGEKVFRKNHIEIVDAVLNLILQASRKEGLK